MTLNFPDTPSNGEKYLAENGIEYTYNIAFDTWTGALSAQNVPINPVPGDVSVTPAFGNPSGTNPGSGTAEDPFIITNSIVPTINGSTESLQTITFTKGKAGDQVLFTNNTTPTTISAKYTQPLGYIDANGKWTGKLVYNDSFGADTTVNTTYTGQLQCGTSTVYFRWVVQQQATPAMFVTAGTALTGTPVSGTDLGATQPTVTGGISPYTYTYEWQTSDNNVTFTAIPSATTSSYSLTSANVGKYIRCIATVSDSSAIQTVSVSSTTAVVNIVSIDVTLSTTEPQTNQPIQATAVVLGGVAPVTTAYQWKADDVNILDATSDTYVVEETVAGLRLSCQITTTDNANTSAVKTSTQTDPVNAGDVPEINTVTLAEVTPDSPDRYTDQSFTVAVDMTSDDPKSDYSLRGKVLGDLSVDVSTSVITKLEEEAVDGSWNNSSTTSAGNAWYGLAYGAGKYVAIATDTSNNIAYSADGINWTVTGVSDSLADVAYGNGKFVAIGATSWYSTDGVSWTAGTNMGGSSGYRSVTYGNGKFVAVAQYNSSGSAGASYSTDGINWTVTRIANTVDGGWYSVAYGDGKFVAVSQAISTQAQLAAYSTDGITWTLSTVPLSNWYSIAYGDGKFVAVAGGGDTRTMYSTDGINWTSSTIAANEWYGVAHGAGTWVAVAYAGTNLNAWSADGINWTGAPAANEGGAYIPVVYGGDKFVAMSYSSPNDVEWSYTGTGVAGTEQVLTLTDTTGLSSINTGDIVVQNSGGTPVTSAITNVAAYEGSAKTILYIEYASTGGQGYVTDFYIDDALAQESSPVTAFTGSPLTGGTMTNPQYAFDGGAGTYAQLQGGNGVNENGINYKIYRWTPTATTTVTSYIDVDAFAASANNDNFGLVVFTDGTRIKAYDSGINPGERTMFRLDLSNLQSNTLTLTDDTNLANFRVGDVVQGGAGIADWNNLFRYQGDPNSNAVWATGTFINPFKSGDVVLLNYQYPFMIDTELLGNYELTLTKNAGSNGNFNIYTNTSSDSTGLIVELAESDSSTTILINNQGTSSYAFSKYITVD